MKGSYKGIERTGQAKDSGIKKWKEGRKEVYIYIFRHSMTILEYTKGKNWKIEVEIQVGETL